MAIEKMKEVNLITDVEHIQQVLLHVRELDCFHPELAQRFVDSVHGLSTLNQSNPYTDTLAKIHEISNACSIDPNLDVKMDLNFDLDELNQEIEETGKNYQLLLEAKKEVSTVIEEDEIALEQLKKIEKFNFSFDNLFQCEYVKLRIGKMPKGNLELLEKFDKRPYLWLKLTEDEKDVLILYMTTLAYEGEVDNLFTSLKFTRIRIPDFVHGKPEEAISNLEEEILSNKDMLKHIEEKTQIFMDEKVNKLLAYEKGLMSLSKTYDLQKYVVVYGQRASISGFIPESEAVNLSDIFKDCNNLDIEINDPYSDSRLTPPTKLKNNWFARPFEMFVEMYGLPAYGEIDPTPFVAITYSLLFGIMFGDLGQGICVSLVGAFMYHKMNMRLGAIMERMGIFAAFFGLCYGSVFGNEELLNPMFHALGFEHKPIEVLDGNFTMTLLICAVAIGAVLTLCSMLINVYTHVKKKEIAKILFSQNGIAGFVFYGAIIAGLGGTMVLNINLFTPVYMVALIGIPAVLIFLQEPLERLLEHEKMFPNGIGGFLMEGVFEMLEICLTFLSNTMSYLRVGGFVLSHAGMMLVVSVLMQITGNASPVVFVLGNIFVMVLEGMIVGIQVLRLEFYEMFSRYFTGNGVAFKSIN